jgi:lipopolysaccharide assembly protein A
MRIKIHVGLITDGEESTTVEACEFARPMKEFAAETVGLCLGDGKKLLQAVQQHVQACSAQPTSATAEKRSRSRPLPALAALSLESSAMRLLIWLLRAFVFFALFAFSLNNRQTATVNWFFGVQWQAPLVIVVLAAFAIGAVFGVIAMVPSWWRHRRVARGRARDSTVTTTVLPAPVTRPPGGVPGMPISAAEGWTARDGV